MVRRLSGPQRGEIWWAELPHDKRRPCLVMTRSAAIPVLGRIVTAPVTRTTRNIPTELRLGPEDGMPTECVASFDNLEMIHRSAFTKRICTLGPDRMAEACVALKAAVDC